MFIYPKFEVDVARSLSNQGLCWPGRGESANEQSLGCNRSYVDLRGLSWRDACRVFDLEATLIERIEAADHPEEEYNNIEDDLYEEDEGLFGLDIGVASTTVALCAAGCVTCSSCNAGVFGGFHHERHPVVAFFAKPNHIELLLQCADESSVGLENSDGMVIVYSDDIRNMRLFAGAMIRARAEFRKAMRRKQTV